MHLNCTYFSFKIYQLKCRIERCNFQDLGGLECSNPTHVNVGHSRYLSEEVVEIRGQSLYFQANVCFQINTLAVCIYRKSSMTGPNPTIPSHDDRIYTSQQPHLLPQSHSSTVDCCILSNSPLVSTLQTKCYGIQSPLFPCITSLLHRFVEELTVE